MKIINKATYQDLRDQANNLELGWVQDYDGSVIYFERWDNSTDRRVIRAYEYTFIDGVLKVDMASEKTVVRTTEYKAVESPIEKRLGVIEKFLIPLFSKKEPKAVIKQFEEETYTVRDVLYIPAGKVDGHGATVNETSIINLVKAFNEGLEAKTIQPSLFHKVKTDKFSINKAWYTETPTMVGDTEVPAFTPMVEIVFKSKKLFDARVSGKLAGLSIGALAISEKLKALTTNNTKPIELFKDFTFLFKGAHLSYTDWSVNGAASLINDVFEVVHKDLEGEPESLLDMIEKSLSSELSEEQKLLLKDISDSEDEEFEPIDKQNKSVDSSATAPSTPIGAQDAGVDKKTLIKGKDTDMSTETKSPEVVALEKQFEAYKRSVKIEKSLSKYNLPDDISEALATDLANLEEISSVVKALDFITAKVVEKANTVVETKTALAQKIDKELGHGEEVKTVEKEFEQSFDEKLAAKVAKKMGGAK
jgi:hypothetical protein